MFIRLALLAFISVFVAGCGGDSGVSGDLSPESRERLERSGALDAEDEGSIFDLFANDDDPNTTFAVNRYLWVAALEVLDFMPIEQADPFTGIITFGYATPPGGAQAYRATVTIQDPALEARSLNVALRTRAGAVSRSTEREIENAILARARQLRIREGNL